MDLASKFAEYQQHRRRMHELDRELRSEMLEWWRRANLVEKLESQASPRPRMAKRDPILDLLGCPK